MSYNLRTANGSNLIILPTNTINTTATSLALIGQNAVNFGLYVNENFIYLMQNFANGTAPTSPLVGQIWYDTSANGGLKYYNGTIWKLLVPPFNGMAGTATASVAGVSIALTLAGNQIVFATSLTKINVADLPNSVSINDTNYAFATRFPHGIAAGVTMATDGNNLRFFGTASTANAFASNMTLSVSGSATGSVSFDGSGNVILPVNLSNVVTAGRYTNVLVSSNGIVIEGGNISANDITTALGYTPAVANGPANSLTFGSNIIIDGVVAGSNIFYGNADITITTHFVSNPMPINGIILLPLGSNLPVGWFECNGQTVTIPNGGGTVITETLTSPNAAVVYIQRVY